MSHQQSHALEVHEHPDEWHRHTPAEGRPQHEHGSKIDPVALGVTFAIIVVTVLALTGGLYVYFRHYTVQMKQQRVETTVWARDYAQTRAAAEAQMQTYRWVDHERVGIPIDQAMERVLSEYGAAQEGSRTDAR